MLLYVNRGHISCLDETILGNRLPLDPLMTTMGLVRDKFDEFVLNLAIFQHVNLSEPSRVERRICGHFEGFADVPRAELWN